MHKTVAAAALFAVPALALSACNSPEVPTDTPGTTPSVWTGSPPPSAPPEEDQGAHGQAQTSGERLTAELKMADGTTVAKADFEFAGDNVTVTVETTESGKLTPGFHGLHIHSVGKCEPNSVAPTGGAPANFNSAGGHFHTANDQGGHPAAGDLPSLQVRGDGSAKLVTVTDAFTAEQLTEGEGTAIIIHEKPDNFANIPPERYQQINGDPPPDAITLATGDAGARVACGVITVR